MAHLSGAAKCQLWWLNGIVVQHPRVKAVTAMGEIDSHESVHSSKAHFLPAVRPEEPGSVLLVSIGGNQRE